MSETEVRTFDAESWVMVFCAPNSDAVCMTSNIADEQCAKMHADSMRERGGFVFKTCKAGELVAALHLIQNREPKLAEEVPRLREALEVMLDATIAPDANCSCHIAPPCSDCVEFSMIREAREQAKAALAGGSDGPK